MKFPRILFGIRSGLTAIAAPFEGYFQVEDYVYRRPGAPDQDLEDLCKTSLDPNMRSEQVDVMLVQHLLTERLFRTVFENRDFTRRNVIAAEIEKVIYVKRRA